MGIITESIEVTPSSTAGCVVTRPLVDPKFLGDLFHGFSGLFTSTYLEDDGFCQDRPSVTFTYSGSLMFDHVSGVVGFVTDVQMFWVAARWVVAYTMANQHPLGDLCFVMKLPSHTVSDDPLSSVTEESVSLGLGASPEPTFVGGTYSNPTPESFFTSHGGRNICRGSWNLRLSVSEPSLIAGTTHAVNDGGVSPIAFEDDAGNRIGQNHKLHCIGQPQWVS